MKTIKIKLYEIDELEPGARERAIKKEIDFLSDVWDGRWTIEEWKQKLELRGFTEPEIQFSGFWSQGDGASFEAKMELWTWIKFQKLGNKFRSLKKKIDEGEIYMKLERVNHRYSHEKSVYAQIYVEGEETPEQSKLTDELQRLVEADRLELSERLYRDLESDYNESTSEEQAIEDIRANEYTYEANGTMRNY